MKNLFYPISFSKFAWDCWCLASIVGIWPRFIEPNIVKTTHLTLNIPNIPQPLHGLRILQFSDLHLQKNTSERFLNRISRKIRSLNPDLIVFTGDFLCFSNLEESERLSAFLNSLSAPYGCYAILGNHDYQDYVSINSAGDYDRIDLRKATIKKGFKKLLSSIPVLTKKVTETAAKVPTHDNLMQLLRKTPFVTLHNETRLVPIKNSYLNISGLGEHMLGRCIPALAFQKYNEQYPGIILLHNPDGIPLLQGYPGEIILCGHTHGGQVNIPGLREKFMVLEDTRFGRGLFKIREKWAYVNRGIGSAMNFRWFSIPEILLLTIEGMP